MNDILTTSSPQSLISAIEKNHEDQLMNLARSFDSSLHDEPDFQWFITDIPSPTFNVVARTRLSPEVADKKIKKIVKSVRRRRVPLGWWVFPDSKPRDLGERLISHGLNHKGNARGTALDLRTIHLDEKSLPDWLRIEPVIDARTLKSFFEPFAIAHRLPDSIVRVLFDSFLRIGLGEDSVYHHYIGWAEDKPVSAISMLLSSGVAGGYNAVTIPEFRKRGIGSAMALHLCKEALSRNYCYRVGVTSKMMWPVNKRLGYKEYCKVGYYQWDIKQKDKHSSTKLRSLYRSLKRLGRNLK